MMTYPRFWHCFNRGLVSLLLLVSTSVSAKDYLGFNLCGKATTDDIERIVAGNGGFVVGIENDNIPKRKIVQIKQYLIADNKFDLSVGLYDDKVFNLTVEGNEFSELLDLKYGEPSSHTISRDYFKKTYTWFYNTKSDSSLRLTYTQFMAEPGTRQSSFTNYSTYECKSMISIIKAAEAKIEREESRKRIGGAKL